MTVTPFKVEFFKDKNQSLKMVKKINKYYLICEFKLYRMV